MTGGDMATVVVAAVTLIAGIYDWRRGWRMKKATRWFFRRNGNGNGNGHRNANGQDWSRIPNIVEVAKDSNDLLLRHVGQLREEIADLDAELDHVKAKNRAEVDRVKTENAELRTAISEVRSDLATDILATVARWHDGLHEQTTERGDHT